MGYVTPEQVQQARDVIALDYILAYELGAFKPIGSGYRSKTHPSLAVYEKGFY